MMNCYDVNIRVPSQEAKSDLVIISGEPSNVEAAKVKHKSEHLKICILYLHLSFQG